MVLSLLQPLLLLLVLPLVVEKLLKRKQNLMLFLNQLVLLNLLL